MGWFLLVVNEKYKEALEEIEKGRGRTGYRDTGIFTTSNMQEIAREALKLADEIREGKIP